MWYIKISIPQKFGFFFDQLNCISKVYPVVFSVVEFASYEDMKNAIKKLDDTDLNGRKIRLFEVSVK